MYDKKAHLETKIKEKGEKNHGIQRFCGPCPKMRLSRVLLYPYVISLILSDELLQKHTHRLVELLARLDGTECILTQCQQRIECINIKRCDERVISVGNEMRLRKVLTHLRSKGAIEILNDMDGFNDLNM